MRTLTIFLKELKDVLRDRRTIMMMVILPLVLVPGMMTVVTKIQVSQQKKAEDKQLTIRFVGKAHAPDLYDAFSHMEKTNLLDEVPVDSIPSYIRQEFLDAAVFVDEYYKSALDKNGIAPIKIMHKGTESLGVTKKRVQSILEEKENEIVSQRLEEMNLSLDIVDAYALEFVDVASTQEIFGKIAGGFLPYIFIIFGFMGAMYPALDLGAGEKERGTLETILSSPASRLEIVLGKFMVILTAAVATALIAISGLSLAVRNFPDIPSDIMQIIGQVLNLKTIVMLMGLVIPVSAFFSALILSLSIYAKSFKEAQSIVAPLNIVIIIPAAIGMLPGMELDGVTALIPVLNVSLASKDLVAGVIDPILMAEVYGSLLLFAAVSIWGCTKWFNREETIFRN